MALPYHSVRASFDAVEGLRALLNLLRHMATLGPEQLNTASKQVACHACHTLRQYVRAHFMAHLQVSATTHH
jgi:hypothetical protein